MTWGAAGRAHSTGLLGLPIAPPTSARSSTPVQPGGQPHGSIRCRSDHLTASANRADVPCVPVMPSLYGCPIPASAETVEVRPILGRGHARPLYRGAVHQNSAVLNEHFIVHHVAHSGEVWQYIHSQAAIGRISPQMGVWRFRLALSFYDQHNSPLALDAEGRSSHVTSESWEFYRHGALTPNHNQDPTRLRRNITLSCAQLAALLTELRTEHQLWVLLAVYSGARRSELERLKPADVDLDSGMLRVRGSGSPRDVPLHPRILPLLRKQKTTTEHLLPSWESEQEDIAIACQRARVPVIGPEDLRRTFCQWLIDGGIAPRVVMKLIGSRASTALPKPTGEPSAVVLRCSVGLLP